MNFQIQRYEGASTIYGPHTLTIYLRQYQELVQAAIRVSKYKTCALAVRNTQKYHRFGIEGIFLSANKTRSAARTFLRLVVDDYFHRNCVHVSFYLFVIVWSHRYSAMYRTHIENARVTCHCHCRINLFHQDRPLRSCCKVN